MNIKQLAGASAFTVAATLAYGVNSLAQENDKAVHVVESVTAPQSKHALQSAYPAQAPSGVVHEHLALNSGVPDDFSRYASVPVRGNLQCTAGAVTDEDGMNQRPYVYVAATSADGVKWAKALDVPKGFYESRATHCLLKGNDLYVLLQSDTQPQQTLSQTLLQIVKIDLRDGTVKGNIDVAIPGAKGAYSAWVKKGEENFRLVDDEVLIAGQYRLVDTDESVPFHVVVKE